MKFKVKKKLRPAKFGWNYSRPELFTASQWQTDPNDIPLAYVVFRTVLSLFVLACYVGNLATQSARDLRYFLIYLTNQGITLLAVYQAMDVILLLWQLRKMRSGGGSRDSMTGLHKAVWVMNTVTTPIAVIITILYWGLLFDPADGNDYWNVYVHGLNSAVVALDLGVGAKPWRWQHFYAPLAYGISYLLFSLIYYLSGGTDAAGNAYIYDVLDWSNPGATMVVVAGAVVGFFLVYGVVYGLFRLRVHVYRRCCFRRRRLEDGLAGSENPIITISREMD